MRRVMAELENICEENIEANYEKYKNVGNKAYQEYEKIYKQMWSKLNGSILEPFAKTLLEHENVVLKSQDELVESIKKNLEDQMQRALENFWHSNSVSEGLISLEMCKDKFKSFEGHKWNMVAKTPGERTRPIRMRFKENRLRYLQKQLNSQNKQLEKVLEENVVLRQHFEDVKHQRTALMDSIETFRQNLELTEAKIMELQQKMIPENEENIQAEINTKCFS